MPLAVVIAVLSFVAATLTDTEVELLLPAASVTAKFTVREPAVGVSDVLSNFTEDNKLVNAACEPAVVEKVSTVSLLLRVTFTPAWAA